MENKVFENIKTNVKELKYNLAALYLAYKRKDTPIYAKIMIIITIGYALSPIDLIDMFNNPLNPSVVVYDTANQNHS